MIFEREFSAQRWLETLQEARCKGVVRLNNTKRERVKITDKFEGEEIPLLIEKGEKRQIKDAYYRGELKVNVGGIWPKDRKEPLWVMGNLKPDELLAVYEKRMKIEQTFRDSKSLLNLEKVMSKRRAHLESTLALVLLAYWVRAA